MDGTVLQVAAAGHKERQTDGHAMRPHCRSPKVAGPGQGDTRRAKDRDMDRHAMQSEAGYLFSGLWNVRRRRAKREREERDRSCLFEREMEKEGTQAGS